MATAEKKLRTGFGRFAARRRISLYPRTEKVDETAKGLEGDERTGAEIVGRALEAPLRAIAENAVSIFATMLTTEAAVADVKEKKAPVPAAGGGEDMDY